MSGIVPRRPLLYLPRRQNRVATNKHFSLTLVVHSALIDMSQIVCSRSRGSRGPKPPGHVHLQNCIISARSADCMGTHLSPAMGLVIPARRRKKATAIPIGGYPPTGRRVSGTDALPLVSDISALTHGERRRAILRQHPMVAELRG
eukprot:1032123-Prymnesium_polylepis.1